MTTAVGVSYSTEKDGDDREIKACAVVLQRKKTIAFNLDVS